MIDFLVGVRCFTFQQANYIKDTMDGFCIQQTNFPYVCFIIDDASKDGEQEVILRYLKDNFDLKNAKVTWKKSTEDGEYVFAQHITNKNCFFLVLLLKKNLYGIYGAKTKLIAQWNDQCKYLALCEGDDYWTDSKKLQKQVDILEADKSLMGCVTNCSVVDMNGNVQEEKRIQPVVHDNRQGCYSLRDFFAQNHTYPTLSVLYRNAHREDVQQKAKTMCNPYMGDWTLWIALLCFGNMYYLDEVTCAYRINPTSLTHDQSKINQRRLGQAKDNFRLLPLVASCLPEEGYQDIKDDLTYNKGWMWFNLANAYKHVHKYFLMAGCLLICGILDPKLLYQKLTNRNK